MTESRSPLLRWILRRSRPLWRFRGLALWSERLFWARWISRRQYDESLLDPSRSFPHEFDRYIAHVAHSPVRVLEVGAGPITRFGRQHHKSIEITATDILADSYARSLKRRGITCPIPTIYADAERLTEQFGRESFDFVYAGNCVDHMEHPVGAIREMIDVVRPGCYVVMFHFRNEGQRQNYAGLHHWNLEVQNGNLIVFNDDERHDVSAMFQRESHIHAEIVDGNVVAEIHKKEQSPP